MTAPDTKTKALQQEPQAATSRPELPRAFTFLGSILSEVFVKLALIIVAAFSAVKVYLFEGKKALYGTAIMRVLFGFTGLGILLTNWSTRLYSFGAGSAWNGELAEPVSDFPKIWIFSLFHRVASNNAWFTFWYIVLITLAVLFIIGWRFRIILPVYFVLWIGFIEMNDMLGDQGDNMYRIALILMFFLDPAARWSLDARRRRKRGEWFTAEGSLNQIGTVLHNLALVCLAAQVIFVYTSGALFKAGGEPWAQGRAIYDPLATARFGTWPALSDFVTSWGPLVAMLTLGTLFLQALFPVMLLTRPTRILALFGILGFHIGIAILMGLPWFSLAMVAIDAIFIRDRTWKRMGTALKRHWRAQRIPIDLPSLNRGTASQESVRFLSLTDNQEEGK